VHRLQFTSKKAFHEQLPQPVPISPVEEIVAEMRAGRMVVLVDEEDRENEGDLVWRPTMSQPRPSTSWPASAVA
jgi:hypothetical protein